MTGINPFDSEFTRKIGLPENINAPGKIDENKEPGKEEGNPSVGQIEKSDENQMQDTSELVDDMDFSDFFNRKEN